MELGLSLPSKKDDMKVIYIEPWGSFKPETLSISCYETLDRTGEWIILPQYCLKWKLTNFLSEDSGCLTCKTHSLLQQ